MSVKKFMSSSIILFLDSLVVAAGGWFFWVVVSKIATVSEVGQATTVFSLVSVVNALAQLGLEYPILRDSSIERDRILASGLILEILITLAIMPVMIFALVALYGGTFIWIAVLLLLFSSVGFISRFVLLGISRAKAIFIIDSIGTIVKFVVGYSLVSAGLGASGILISFLSLSIVVSSIALWLAKSVFEFKLGDIQFFRNFIVRGLVNTPAKLSGVLIFSLSVVLLAAFGTSPSDIGRFYVALTISVLGGGLVSSMAFMVIPASSMSGTDLSSGSLRIGVTITAPIIAALITSPKGFLTLIGTQYASAELVLIILSLSILPFSVVRNIISKLNYSGQSRKLLIIGVVQISTFLVAFTLLVPPYGTIGAALSIMIAFIASFILSVIWDERVTLRYIGNATIAIGAGWATGLTINSTGPESVYQFIAVISSITVTCLVVILLKNTSTSEIGRLLKIIINKTDLKKT